MYTDRQLHACLLLILIFYVSKIHAQVIPYDTVVCFGDSNSDTGNVYNLTGSQWPPSPPYYQGRFSNEKVWIERLGISKLINYAYGSATTDNNLVVGITAMNMVVPGVRQQIAKYKNTTDLTKVNFDRTIYAIWVGLNDYYYNMTLPPSVVVASLMNGVNDLISLGVKHILIVNQPSLAAYPFVAGSNMSSYLNLMSMVHNANLSSAIQSLQSKAPNTVFYSFDIYTFIQNIFNNMTAYGINSTKNCWSQANGTVVQLCSTPDTYLFLDEYHFTARVHQMIANNVQKLLATSRGTVKSPYTLLIILIFLSSFFNF